ncbi:MAG: TonB-dependent receptor plug domain-containing protein, partial [Litorimonas sp.]
MKRFFLGAAVAAISSAPAWAQVQADFDDTYDRRIDRLAEDARQEGADLVSVGRTPTALDDEIIVSADRLGYLEAQDLTTPASVLTQAEIEARGQQYVSELLRALPGIAVSTSGPGAGVTQIRVRGAEANQVLVLIDGVEAANPSTGEIDLSGLRAADIVKIEVLRGEQSALYGSDAVAGVVSIVTRAGETRPGWRASVEAGTYDTLEGQV